MDQLSISCTLRAANFAGTSWSNHTQGLYRDRADRLSWEIVETVLPGESGGRIQDDLVSRVAQSGCYLFTG